MSDPTRSIPIPPTNEEISALVMKCADQFIDVFNVLKALSIPDDLLLAAMTAAYSSLAFSKGRSKLQIQAAINQAWKDMEQGLKPKSIIIQ